MDRSNQSFRIVGTGICAPSQVVTNACLRDIYNPKLKSEWASDVLGIHERRIAADGVLTSDLAAEAVADLLSRTGVSALSIDLLILATASPDLQAPATSCIAQAKAGLSNAVAFDVSAVCSGYLFALTCAAALLHSGQARRAVVVGADTFSRNTDWSRRDCVFFGDGAGATLLERDEQRREDAFFDAELFTDGQRSDVFRIPGSGRPFEMDGPGVFEMATHAVPTCVNRLLERNGVQSSDVDVVVPHQPSIALLRSIAELIDVPFQKFQTNMDRYANTAGATIPIMLHETLLKGTIKQGDLVMFAAAGAGFTAGAALHRWH